MHIYNQRGCKGLGLRVKGSGLRVNSFGFGVNGIHFKGASSTPAEFRVNGLGFRDSREGLRDSCLGLRGWILRFKVTSP